jgi:hypothetical protein
MPAVSGYVSCRVCLRSYLGLRKRWKLPVLSPVVRRMWGDSEAHVFRILLEFDSVNVAGECSQTLNATYGTVQDLLLTIGNVPNKIEIFQRHHDPSPAIILSLH